VKARWVNLAPATAGDVLREHFPVEVRCDHELSRDKVFCNCSMVDLGWHESVGDAVASWVSHVIDEMVAHA
jgi:hypothetical protein